MSGTVKKDEFDRFLAEAKSWETDKAQALEKSKQIAWRVASFASLIALSAVWAVAALTPLKTTEPYVIRADNVTGIVDVVSPLSQGPTSYNEAINKYFTQLYVRYREGYSAELAEDYYTLVGIMSSAAEQQRFYEWFNPKTSAVSPIKVYGQYAKVRITIKSTSFIKPNVALVRYVREVDRGSDKSQLSHWAATITFSYSGAPMRESDRARNPLGYQVLEYRTDADAILPEGPKAQPKAAAATANTTGPTVMPGQPAVPALQPTAPTQPN